MPLKLESRSGDAIRVDSDGEQIVLTVNGQATLLTIAEASGLATALNVIVAVARAVRLDDFPGPTHKS